MRSQVHSPCEPLVAVVARELLELFTCLIFEVQTLVLGEVSLIREGLATDITGEGFLLSMDSYVSGQAKLGV